MSSYLEDYIEWVERNPDQCCNKIRLVFLKMLKPIVEGKSKEFYFDKTPGNKFVAFCQGDIKNMEEFQSLMKVARGTSNKEKISFIEQHGKSCGFIKQSKGDWANLPLILEPYQKAYMQAKLGIKRREDNRRAFKETFLVVGRKNGKTTLEAADGLWFLLSEAGAEIYVAATVQNQARRCWEEAQNMVSSSPALSGILTSRVFPRPEISFKTNKLGKVYSTSKFLVLSKEVKSQDGLNASCAIIDEVHALPHETYNILKQSTSARSEPMIDMITTSGFIRKGLYDDLYEHCSKVLNGEIVDTTILPIIYELDVGDVWQVNCMDNKTTLDEKAKAIKVWRKANPTLGSIKRVDYMSEQVARSMSDLSYASTVKTKDFNIIGVAENQWLTAEEIEQPRLYTEDDIKQFDGTIAIGGFDLSKFNDCTAWTTLLFDQTKNVVIAKIMVWVTKSFLESPEAKSSRVPWQAWIDRGLVRISGTDGTNAINYHDILKYVLDEEIRQHGYMYDHIGYDSWSSSSLISDFIANGFSSEYCLKPVIQGYKSLTQPTQLLRVLLSAKRFNYLDNPVMKWMLTNIQIEEDVNGNIRPVKRLAKRANKIDAPMSSLDALALYQQNSSIYLPDATDTTIAYKSGNEG